MTITTTNELAFLRAIVASEYHDGNDVIGNPVWTDCIDGWSRQRKGGTVSSLTRKGLIGTCDDTVWITAAGLEATQLPAG